MYKACFVDMPYKRVRNKDIYKFTKLKKAYESRGHEIIFTENIEDVLSIQENENKKIVLFWHLSSSRWDGKVVSPAKIKLIVSKMTTNFHSKYGVTDDPKFRKAAEETRWFDMAYSWPVFYDDFE